MQTVWQRFYDQWLDSVVAKSGAQRFPTGAVGTVEIFRFRQPDCTMADATLSGINPREIGIRIEIVCQDHEKRPPALIEWPSHFLGWNRAVGAFDASKAPGFQEISTHSLVRAEKTSLIGPQAPS